MSIFITSLGATDNEICAPITHSILNLICSKGFKFRGIPAVESSILIDKNAVNFTLSSCDHTTSPLTLSFDEVTELSKHYAVQQQIPSHIQKHVGLKLAELESLTSSQCPKTHSCAHCTLVNRKLYC
ncbi:hypothetical protein [uncultured Neptuniibacter sp.]|uniref:hypothetical protein n=1 Tax=uncultured Neptuniibacter sp. TaxID=502143 RepID=UPI00260C503D|nr:hypothetical protein [uncultured Neptuniibacter sp.]